MKLYLLDSTPVAAYLHGREAVVDLITPWVIRREVATSILVYAEVTEYIKGLSDRDFERVPGLQVKLISVK